MSSVNKILLIDPEEDLRIAAKIFLAGEGVFIDTAPTADGVDFSAYKSVIAACGEIPFRANVVILEKPYTASDLLDTVKKAACHLEK